MLIHKTLATLSALLLAAPAVAADKRVFRVDSLIAAQKDGAILVQAKGAVQTGGWTRAQGDATLKLLAGLYDGKSDLGALRI